MESSSPRQATTLASIIDAEKVIAPPRARALLAALAQAQKVPEGPTSVRAWSEVIVVDHDAAGTERASFTGAAAPTTPADRAASTMRHIDALRAAAVTMLWGRETVKGPDGQPHFPRLRKLLVDQWDDTRGSCDGPDKLMMFFDATLALDRAAEPRAGREGFKSLSLPSMDTAKKDVRVGTIGVPFEAIIDTGRFKKAARPDAPPTARPNQGPWLTPQVPPIAQQAAPPLSPDAAVPPARRATIPLVASVVVGFVLVALAFIVFAR
jgi:hypothetical protein